MLAVLAFGCAWSQDDTSRTHVHLSTGATVASGFGRTQALSWVAPSVELKMSDRLTVSGGFAAAGTLLGGYEVHRYTPSVVVGFGDACWRLCAMVVEGCLGAPGAYGGEWRIGV